VFGEICKAISLVCLKVPYLGCWSFMRCDDDAALCCCRTTIPYNREKKRD
jgi:hypothetical protein